MKIVALVLAGLVVFAGTLAGALAATGNLNAEALGRLMGQQPAAGALPEKVQGTDALAEEGRARLSEIEAREQRVAEKEKQLDQREKDLQALRTQLEALKTQVEGAVSNAAHERQAQMETVANTVTSMKPDAAAERLEKFPVEDQAEIIKRITKVKDRAKILEAMKPETAARVMTFLQQPSAM